jgi:hypothetical protein
MALVYKDIPWNFSEHINLLNSSQILKYTSFIYLTFYKFTHIYVHLYEEDTWIWECILKRHIHNFLLTPALKYTRYLFLWA